MDEEEEENDGFFVEHGYLSAGEGSDGEDEEGEEGKPKRKSEGAEGAETEEQRRKRWGFYGKLMGMHMKYQNDF